MRMFGPLICAIIAVGCSKPAEVKPKASTDAYAGWPADTLKKPDFTGVVERSVERIPNDAESTRFECTVQVPDWVDAKNPIRFGTPSGSLVEFHYLPRDSAFSQQDDAQLTKLLKGAIKDGPTLVVARPWRGWYGEAGSQRAIGNKAVPIRVRVYNLFTKEDQLEIHAEWPTGNKQALAEAEELVAHVAFSVQRAKG